MIEFKNEKGTYLTYLHPEVKFTVKDSGARASYKSGMVRDTTEGKIAFDLIFDGPMVGRWADHLTKGAKKYAKRNWMKACGTEELERFRESAARHFYQWMSGDVDEDHAAAVFFNINSYEYTKDKLQCERSVQDAPAETQISGTDVVGATLVGTHVD